MSTVHRWFLRLSRAGVFERLGHALAMADRERVGREASPTAAVPDNHKRSPTAAMPKRH